VYSLWQAAERGPDLDFIVNDCAKSAQRAQPAPKIPCDFSCELTVSPARAIGPLGYEERSEAAQRPAAAKFAAASKRLRRSLLDYFYYNT